MPRSPMSGTSVRLDGAEKVIARLKYWAARFPALTGRAMFTAAHATLIPAMRDELQAQESIYTGQLWQKIMAKVVTTTVGSVSIDVGGMTPYALNVEEGTEAHTPDHDLILDWVEKKNNISGPAADAVAAAVIAKIEAVGADDHPFVIPGFHASKSAFKSDTVARIRAALLRSRP